MKPLTILVSTDTETLEFDITSDETPAQVALHITKELNDSDFIRISHYIINTSTIQTVVIQETKQ